MEKNAGTARRRSTSSRRQDTKVAVVTRRLRAKRGASIDELAMHTGLAKAFGARVAERHIEEKDGPHRHLPKGYGPRPGLPDR